MNEVQVLEGDGDRLPWVPTEAEKVEVIKGIIANMEEAITNRVEQAKEAGLQKILDSARKDQERLDAFTKEMESKYEAHRHMTTTRLDEINAMVEKMVRNLQQAGVAPQPQPQPGVMDPNVQSNLWRLENAIKEILKCFYALNNEIMSREQVIRGKGVYDQEILKNLIANEIGQIVMQKWTGISSKIMNACNSVGVHGEY